MATVIDALLITLGLDAKALAQGSKRAQEELDKLKNKGEKTAKGVEDSTRKSIQFFSQLRTQALGFFGTVLGVGGFEELVRHVVTTASSIDKLSNRFDVSVDFVSKFGNVVKQVGGSVEEAQGFISQMAESILQLNAGVKPELLLRLQSITGLAQKVGISSFIGYKGGKASAEETIKNIAEVFARSSPEARQVISQTLGGLSGGVFEALRQGNFAGRLGSAPGIDRKFADAAQKLVGAFNDLQNKLTVLAAEGIEPVTGAFEQLFKTISALQGITGDEFLEKIFGIKPDKSTPQVLYDVPDFFRRHGLPALGDLLEGKEGPEDYLKKGVEMLKAGKGTPIGTPGKTSSFGDVPIGLAAVANSVSGVPGFRPTSTTGGQHAGRAHAEGRAMDFVVDPAYYDAVVAELRKRFEKEDLTVIDAHKKPDSRFWTGPHIHVEFATKAAAERFQAAHGDLTTNSTQTHIGTINVHAPSSDAGEITKKIDTTIRRSSNTVNADTGFE